MNYFLDTNIFLRILIKEDKKTFNDCFCLFKLIKEAKIKVCASGLILTEITWVLKKFYKFSKEDIIKVLKGILNLRGLKFIESVNIQKAIELYSKNNIKFVDCLISSNKYISNKKIKIISYDKDFDKIKVIRVEPAEVIKKYK